MSEVNVNMSSTLSGTQSSASGPRHETPQNSSGFSISEYLTKLAKGGDSFSQQNYQQETGSHTSHYKNDSLPSVSTSYSHPPPRPQSDVHHAGAQLNLVPPDSAPNETNWWMRQQPPLPPHSEPSNNLHIDPPPITSWSRDGDPPPAISWPAPRPDIWSSAATEQRDSTWQQQQSAALDPGKPLYKINLYKQRNLYTQCIY